MGDRADATLEVTSAGDSVVVVFAGEFDFAEAERLTADLETIMSTSPRRLVIDTAAVTFFDSSWVRLVIWLYRLIEQVGGELRVDHPSPVVRRVLARTGIFQLPGVVLVDPCDGG